MSSLAPLTPSMVGASTDAPTGTPSNEGFTTLGTTAQTAPVPGSPFSEGVRFFTDDDFNGAARFAMSKATQGVMDFGMVLATLGRITDASPQSWLQEWVHTGQQLE